MNLFGLSLPTLLGRALFLIAIVPIHEYAHAWMAGKMGDNTARYQGRLDMNPFSHLDPIGTLLILFTGFGWARPVPINSNNFYDRKKGIFLTSLAGPAANIILAFVVFVVYKILYQVAITTGMGLVINVLMVLSSMITTSVYMAVFNLIPIPPLDGWNMLSVVLPYDKYYMVLERQREISFVFMVLILFTDIVSIPISFLSGLILNLFEMVTFFI